MGRIISFWMALKLFALIEPSKHTSMWDQDGQVVTIPVPCSYTRTVPLAEFHQGVIKEMAELQMLIGNLVSCIKLAYFRLSKLVDNMDTKILLFSQPRNMLYFQPFINTIWACMESGTCVCTNKDHRQQSQIFTKTGKL